MITDDFEIFLIEDCGGDRSWPMVVDLAKRDPRVRGLQFSGNFGQHYGITAGLDHCESDWVVVMDCDFLDRPEEFPRLYVKAQEGQDVILARCGQRNDPTLKKLMSWLFYRVFSFQSDMDYDGNMGNFRIISRKVVNSFRSMRERLRFFGGLVAWMGFPTASIDVQHDERFAGETSYTFGKLWRLAGEIVIAHSDKPPRLSIRFGFVIALFAFICGNYIVYRALVHGIPIMGWSSLIASVYFLGGVIISILGIIGIYLGSAFDETKKRPPYIVRAAAGFQHPSLD